MKSEDETFVQKDPDPDVTFHELSKFVRLTVAGNPTVIEALFMADYTGLSEAGAMLVGHRDAFLSTDAVSKTYVGYVNGQIKRLMNRGDFSSDLKKRREKHARHCYRLLLQGTELLSSGTLTLALTDSQRAEAFAVSKLPDAELSEYVEEAISEIKKIPSVLPDEPNRELINKLLLHLRLPERHEAP